MAHQLSQRANGFVEFAAAGPREAVWHQLGQYLDDNAPLETWKEQAGMDWDVVASPVMFTANGQVLTDSTKNVLYRSDSLAPLGVVSAEYKIVQPDEVLEFFRDLTTLHGMKLSAAGCLYGGRRFWAIADVGKSALVSENDRINGYLLLVTSADGTLATQAKLTSTRVVCNNTLTVAMGQNTKNIIRVTHARKFNAEEVKIDLGLVDKSWDQFINNIRALSEVKTSDSYAEEFFARLATPDDKPVNMDLLNTQRQVEAMMHFYKRGAGADMTYGNAWGMLNAVTELHTHGNGKRDSSRQFENAYLGASDNIKTKAMNRLLELV